MLFFASASQNEATTVALLDTLSASSTNGVGKVYRQLKDILGVAADQKAKSLLQQRAEVSVSRDRAPHNEDRVFTGVGPDLPLVEPSEQTS
jgi:hypothetical protein